MSTIKANTLLHSDGTTTTQPSIPALDKRMAKAWVNFNGTGTVAINSSYNISSITDNSVGDYTLNFAVAMPSVYFAGAGLADSDGDVFGLRNSVGWNTASSARVANKDTANNFADRGNLTCVFFSS
jgi:hypothetical protein